MPIASCLRPVLIVCVGLGVGCGDSGQTSGSGLTTNTPATDPTTTTDTVPTTSSDDPSTGTTQEPTEGLSDATSSSASTTTTATSEALTDSSSSTADDTTTEDDTTTADDRVCDPNEVEDTIAFTYVSQFDTGIPDPVLQATYYNSHADEVMVMSFSGKARRFKVDGTPISDVMDVPAEALPKLDGATYDPIGKLGLLINQACVLTEVEPQTLAVQKTQQLGFGMSICAGLALGLDNNLYIASYGTNEMVIVSRDGQAEVGRINVVQVAGLTGFDGISLIAGSENFLIMSTSPKAQAAIINPAGGVVVPTADIGLDQPPLLGGMPMLPDAVLTICGNGHAWVCEAYNATCFDYAPADGDKNACACLIPQ